MNEYYIRKIKEYYSKDKIDPNDTGRLPTNEMYVFKRDELDGFSLSAETIDFLCDVGIPNQQITWYLSLDTPKPNIFEINGYKYIRLVCETFMPFGLLIRENDNSVGSYFQRKKMVGSFFRKKEIKTLHYLKECENIIQFVLFFMISEIEEMNVENALRKKGLEMGFDPESGKWKLSEEKNKWESILNYLSVRKMGELYKKIDSRGILHGRRILGQVNETEWTRDYLFDAGFENDWDTFQKVYDLACTEKYDKELEKFGFDFTDVYKVRDGIITVEDFLNENIKKYSK